MRQLAATPLQRISLRAAFGLSQGARVAWYMGQGLAMSRLRALASGRSGPDADGEESGAGEEVGKVEEAAGGRRTGPGRARIMADMRDLFARDLANVEAGVYPMPRAEDGPLAAGLARSWHFFADLPKVHSRRRANRHDEVARQTPEGKRPRYYLQNFHFQSGGWMSRESARIYDVQVEVLFNGTANAMRRQALVPLAELISGRDQRTMRLVDLACGTGRFLDAAARAFPRLDAVGIDMSDAYVAEARAHTAGRARTRFCVGKAEQMPLPDASVDAVTAIFLFHELPPQVRRHVAAEIARVLRPGGRFMLLDSLQLGDRPGYDAMLEMFPQNFHEPYYGGYIRADLGRLFGAHGLRRIAEEPVFVSKLSVFEKPA